MRIERPLLKLPIRFCGETLAREVQALPPGLWMEHPQKFDGNSAVPLVSPGGAMTNQWAGAMAPTEALHQCPYIMQIMAALDSTWGRSRLMGLAPGAVVPSHVDIHYYWRTHLRLHIPVITNPGVAFKCAGETFHMEPGECWILNSFFQHSVENRGQETRIHLVLDTMGSARLWDLIEAADQGTAAETTVAPESGSAPSLDFEQINAPAVMSPWEIRSHIAYLASWMDERRQIEAIERVLDRFLMAWGATWARFETSDEGLPDYVRHLTEVRSALAKLSTGPILMRNRWDFQDSLQRFVFANAIDPARLAQSPSTAERPLQSPRGT